MSWMSCLCKVFIILFLFFIDWLSASQLYSKACKNCHVQLLNMRVVDGNIS